MLSNDELAKKKWEAIPSQLREELVSNVYCSKCGVTTIVNYEVDSENFNIILKGKCNRCDGKVARVID